MKNTKQKYKRVLKLKIIKNFFIFFLLLNKKIQNLEKEIND